MTSLIAFLTGSGLGSRRHCFRLLIEGLVLVNGQVAEKSSAEINPAEDVVEVEGHRVEMATRRVYLKMNKPAGVVSTTSDPWGRPMVLDLVPQEFSDLRLFLVGRLDADTTGLLLLTNDGTLSNSLTHPSFEVEKEYNALLDRPLQPGHLLALERGVVINDEVTAPARIKPLAGSVAPWYSITLHEGKKRQVRFMALALDYRVLQLIRVRIHSLRLGDLAPGQVEEVTQEELKGLMSSLPLASTKGVDSS